MTKEELQQIAKELRKMNDKTPREKMVRRMIMITPDQNRRMQKLAKKRHQSYAVIFRLALDAYLKKEMQDAKITSPI